VTSEQDGERAACWLCDAVVKLHGQANCSGHGIVNRNRFIAASEGAKELLWLKRLLGEFGEKICEVPVDNASAVKQAKNPEFHEWSKLVEVRYYFYVSVTRMVP
jgi:hypothetical protein